MSELKSRHFLAAIGVVVLVIGAYVGWQVYQGQQMASGSTSGASSSSANPSVQGPSSFGCSANSGIPPSPSGTTSSKEYKQLMTQTYQQTLQAMQTVKSNSLALQGKKLSLAAYRSTILESQATFTAAEEFVRANPPTEGNLNASYQKFLAGISLAKESMGVVLKGISSFSPSNFYAAREMGKQAQQQVIDGYSHF